MRPQSNQPNGEAPRATSPQHPLFAVLEAEDRRKLAFQLILFVLAALVLGALVDLVGYQEKTEPPRVDCPKGQFLNSLGGCSDKMTESSTQSCSTDTPKTDACACDGGREVDGRGFCVLSAPPPDRCRVARDVRKRCEEKRGGKSSAECSATELFKTSALGDKDAEALLASFFGTVTIHFGAGQPKATKPSKELIQDLVGMRKAINGCGNIFLLGRADGMSGTSTDNDKMAQRRMKLVRLAILAASGLTGAERDRLDQRILDFGLGSNLAMDVVRFGRIYTKTLDSGDPKLTQALNAGLAALRNDTLTPAERIEVEAAINRSVQVIFVDSSCTDGAMQ